MFFFPLLWGYMQKIWFFIITLWLFVTVRHGKSQFLKISVNHLQMGHVHPFSMAMLVITRGYSPFCPLSHRHLFSEDTAGMVFSVGWVDTGWTRRFVLLKPSSYQPFYGILWDGHLWDFGGLLGYPIYTYWDIPIGMI